jgi:mRNA-degrading endonuclease YafQ of YafQ-DinJ toxin-antitoxin module
MANVKFKKCNLFLKSFEGYKTDKKVTAALDQFVKFKETSPSQAFGSKDYKYKSGILSDYWHAGLSFDDSLIYQIQRKGDDYTFLLYGLYSHDDSGTGQPPNMKKQRALLTKLDNQEFV